jgi:hypothetical protein
MSLIDYDSLSAVAVLSHYIVESKGFGHFLAREDVSIIEKWLTLANGNAEFVILQLEGILNKKIERQKATGVKLISLKSIDKRVSKRIEDNKLLKGMHDDRTCN